MSELDTGPDAMAAARIDLAACYRAVARYGMTDLVYNHITLRVPGRPRHMLINNYGLLYDEICASNLCEIDATGRIVDAPKDAIVNRAGLVIHSAVHEARADLNCVIHTHTRAGMAVSAMQCGLLPLTQTAMWFHGAVSYHDYLGPALSMEDRDRLERDLGTNSVMILRNHGLLACGATVGEAFLNLYMLENACRAQVDILSSGTPVNICSDAVGQATRDAVVRLRFDDDAPYRGAPIEWAAVRRQLDRTAPGYRD